MLENAPPSHPVIIAGSTGSVPATARLMSVVSHLPKGAVILPGLDREMHAESWLAAQHEPTHPQSIMAALGPGRVVGKRGQAWPAVPIIHQETGGLP